MDNQPIGKITWKQSEFVWEIENFSKIDNEVGTGSSIISPAFYTAYFKSRTLVWRLKLFPNGKTKGTKDFISILLTNMNKFDVVAQFSLSILNDSHEAIFKMSSDVEPIIAMRRQGWFKFAKRASILDEKNRVLVNDKLVVSCAILSADSPINAYQIAETEERVLYNKHLLETGNYSDVTFSIESKELHLHKAVVASVSPFFEAMFMNDMKESNANVVTITDFKYEVMNELFKYIYVRNMNGVNAVAPDLLIAAHKYDIKCLKMFCELSLCSSLNDDNALQRLNLAVMYDASYLKSKVTDYVAKKLKVFMEKVEFKELNPECKDEVYAVLASKIPVE